MNSTDKQQVAEFLRWISESQSINPEGARHLCAFFYGRPIGNTLDLEEA